MVFCRRVKILCFTGWLRWWRWSYRTKTKASWALFMGCDNRIQIKVLDSMLLVTWTCLLRLCFMVRLTSENVKHKTHFRLNFIEMLTQAVNDIHVKWHTVLLCNLTVQLLYIYILNSAHINQTRHIQYSSFVFHFLLSIIPLAMHSKRSTNGNMKKSSTN